MFSYEEGGLKLVDLVNLSSILKFINLLFFEVFMDYFYLIFKELIFNERFLKKLRLIQDYLKQENIENNVNYQNFKVYFGVKIIDNMY